MEGDGINESVILNFAVEGTETIVAAAEIQDGLTASVEAFASSATSAYAKANAAQKSIIDAYMQQAQAAKESGASAMRQSADIKAAIADLEKYAISWAQGANASITGSAAAAEAAGVLRVELAQLAAAQAAQAAAAKAAAIEQAALAKLAGNPAAVEGYLAQADAIVTSNVALGLQQVQLRTIAAELQKDVAGFAALGDAGIAAAEESSEALTVVRAALASIAAEQKVVMDGMAGIAAASVVAGNAAEAGIGKEIAREAAKLAGVESGIISMAGKMAPLAAGIGLVILAKDATEYAASLEHMHEKLGIATETLSVFGVAARQNGMEVQDMNRSIAMLFKNIDLALHQGGKKQLVNLSEMLGMSQEDTIRWGKTADATKILLDTITAIDAIPDPVTRLAKAQELLGRTAGAGQLLNTIHQLAGAGFEQVTKQARELGMVIDEETARKALEFERSWARMKLALMGFGTQLIPIVSALGQLLDVIIKIKNLTPESGAVGFASSATQAVINPLVQLQLIQRAYATTRDAAEKWISEHSGRALNALGVGAWGVSGVGVDRGPAPQQSFEEHMQAAIDRTPPLTAEQKLKQEELLKLAQDQYDIAEKQYLVAVARNVVEKQRADYALRVSEITKEFDKQKATIEEQRNKREITPEVAAAAIAKDQLTAQLKLNKEKADYNVQAAETRRDENEALRVLSDQLAIQRLQTSVAGGTSAIVKEQVSFAEKQLSIQNDLAAAERRITAPGPNALPQEEQQKQLALERANVEQKTVAALLDHLSVAMRITVAEAATTREMNLAADAEERNLQIARNSIALELLNQHTIQTTSDIQRGLALERQNALTSLAYKRAQIDEEERRALEEQNLAVADAMAKAMLLGVDDPAAIEAAFARIAAIRRKANSERVQAELQTQSTIANGEFQSIQKTNEAWAEARYQKRIMDAQAMANAAQDMATIFGDPMMKVAADFLHGIVDAMKKAADQANEIWRTVGENITQGFSTLFSDLARGGGFSTAFKDMGQQFESSFGGIVEKRIKVWSDELQRVAQGKPLLDQQGNAIAGTTPTGPEQNSAQLKLGGFMAAQAGLAGYSAGSGHGQATISAISAATSAAIAFAETGPYAILAAVIAAAASEIGSAISTAQKQSEYLYGVPVFTNGKASIGAERNINAQKDQEMVAKLQDTFDSTWNGFIAIMGKLGGINPQMPDRILGGFQPAPSANWEKHFQQYLTDTLPLQIAALFKAGMEKSFVSSGVTSEAFDKFWAEANALDPQKRMQFWQDLSDGIVSFAHAQAVFDGVKRLGGDYAGSKFDAQGNPLLGGDNDFISALRTGAKQVFDIARNMVSLTGPDRIAAFKQMGASVDQIAASFAQFIQQVGASLKNVKQQFNDAYLQHNLAAAGEVRDANGNIIHQNDPNAQARLLEQAYNQNLYKIQHASSLGLNPQDIEALTQQSINYLNQILALDPTKEANDWWMKQMSALQTSSEAALKLMGDVATDEMQKFLDSIKPFKDYMLGMPVEIDPSIVALEAEFDGLAAAIAALTVSITNNTSDINGGTGTGTNGGTGSEPHSGNPNYRDPNDGGVNRPIIPGVGDSNGNSIGGGGTVIIQFNGGVFVGMEEFQQAVNDGVALANRESPQKFLPVF